MNNTEGRYIGDIKPKVGNKLYNVYTKLIYTVAADNDPQVGYVWVERYNQQGEFMYPHWVLLENSNEQ